MAAKTDPINTSNPAGNSDPKQGDDYIRTLARAVLELLTVDHYVGVANPWGSESSGDETGEHAKVTLHAVLGADPDPGTDKGALYIKTANAKPELFYEDADDNVIQLTSGGTVLFGSLSSIAKDTYLKAIDNAGTGTIDLIKGNASDKPVIKAGAELSTSGDPTAAAGIACKEYSDKKELALLTQATAGIFGARTTSDTTPTAFAKTSIYRAQCDGFLTVNVETNDQGFDIESDSNATPTTEIAVIETHMSVHLSITVPIKKDDYWRIVQTLGSSNPTSIYWLPIGTGGCVKQ